MLPLHHLRTYTLTHAHNTITPMGDSGERPTTHNTSNAHMCAAQPQRTSRTPTSDRIERYASITPFADIHPRTHTTRSHPWATRARGPPHTAQATHTCAPAAREESNSLLLHTTEVDFHYPTCRHNTSDVQEHLSLCRGASTLGCLSRTGRIELPSPPYKGGGFPVSYVQTKNE